MATGFNFWQKHETFTTYLSSKKLNRKRILITTCLYLIVNLNKSKYTMMKNNSIDFQTVLLAMSAVQQN